MARYSYINCKNCSDQFMPSRVWQVFCSSGCKIKWHRLNGNFCFYCGDISSDRDHVEPVSMKQIVKRHFRCEYVKSCKECNGSLSNILFNDLGERVKFLIDRYTKKYKLDKPAIAWDDEEVQELGPKLRSFIKKKLTLRMLAEQRVQYLNHVLRSFIEGAI